MASTPVFPRLDLYHSAMAWLERALAGNKWMGKATVVLTLLSLFLHFPSNIHLRMHLSGERLESTWTAIEQQRDHPFTPQAHRVGSHEEKTAYRLTVPLIAKAFSLGPLGIYILQFLLGIAMIRLALAIAFRHCADRGMALLFTAGLVFIFPGSAAFFDTWGHRDPFAYFFLVLAIWSTRAPLVFVAVFLAAFTDERGLIASAFVLLYHMLEQRGPGEGRLLSRQVIAVVLAWVAYFAGRLALSHFTDLRTATGGIGVADMLDRIDPLMWGLWSGLEGAWLIVMVFFAALFVARERQRLLLYGTAFTVVMVVALLVTDITRSMAYGFMLLFPALAWLHRRLAPEHLRVLLLFACVVSLIHPMYYTFGNSTLYAVDPLYIKVLRLLRLWL
jgi:hypothetical protein